MYEKDNRLGSLVRVGGRRSDRSTAPRNGFVSLPASRRPSDFSAILSGQRGFALGSFGFVWVRLASFRRRSRRAARLIRSPAMGHFRAFWDIAAGRHARALRTSRRARARNARPSSLPPRCAFGAAKRAARRPAHFKPLEKPRENFFRRPDFPRRRAARSSRQTRSARVTRGFSGGVRAFGIDVSEGSGRKRRSFGATSVRPLSIRQHSRTQFGAGEANSKEDGTQGNNPLSRSASATRLIAIVYAAVR